MSYDLSGPACASVPAYGECKLIVAAFNTVLGLQVCHELCALAVDGLDQVTWAQGSQGCFASSMNLWLEKSHGWYSYIMWPSAIDFFQPQNLASMALCQ